VEPLQYKSNVSEKGRSRSSSDSVRRTQSINHCHTTSHNNYHLPRVGVGIFRRNHPSSDCHIHSRLPYDSETVHSEACNSCQPPGSLSNLEDPPGISFEHSELLRHAWNINSKSRVILSDFSSLFIFHPPVTREVMYERVSEINDPSLLRIAIAAYLYDSLPEELSDMYIFLPSRRDFFDIVLPQGVSIRPNTPIQSDEEVFATHCRHSDFDFYSLTQDRERALQFFRWKTYIKKNLSPRIASSGDVLLGVTMGFVLRHHEFVPFFPPDDLPLETADHIRSVQRPCPLKHIIDAFMSSDEFSLELLQELTPARDEDISRTYTCRIVSINNRPAGDALPILCVKLFDDRFHHMEPPGDNLRERTLCWWWTLYITAEDHVRREHAAYKKLEFMQGSLIPRFYGSHSVSKFIFTLNVINTV
jgi:hypothetical protein